MKALFGIFLPCLFAFPFLVLANAANAAVIEQVSPDRDALVLKLNKIERAQARVGERVTLSTDGSSTEGEVRRRKGISAIVKLDESSEFKINQRVAITAISNENTDEFGVSLFEESDYTTGPFFRFGFVNIDGTTEDPIVFGAGYEKPYRHNFIVGGAIDYWKIDEDLIDADLSMMSFSGYVRHVTTLNEFRAGPLLGLAYHRLSASAGGTSVSDSDISLDFGVNLEYDIHSDAFTSFGILLRSYETLDMTQLTIGFGMPL